MSKNMRKSNGKENGEVCHLHDIKLHIVVAFSVAMRRHTSGERLGLKHSVSSNFLVFNWWLLHVIHISFSDLCVYCIFYIQRSSDGSCGRVPQAQLLRQRQCLPPCSPLLSVCRFCFPILFSCLCSPLSHFHRMQGVLPSGCRLHQKNTSTRLHPQPAFHQCSEYCCSSSVDLSAMLIRSMALFLVH